MSLTLPQPLEAITLQDLVAALEAYSPTVGAPVPATSSSSSSVPQPLGKINEATWDTLTDLVAALELSFPEYDALYAAFREIRHRMDV